MTTVSYILFACDIISGIIFVAYIIYVFLKKNAATIQRNIIRISSRIRTNLKISTQARSIQSQATGTDDSPTSTERFMSTDRPFSPLIKIRSSEEEMSTTRKENNDAELQVLSPTNHTEAGLLIFDSLPRESSLPVKFPAEDPDFQQFAEILKHEMRNNPRISPKSKIEKVFKFTKEDWTNELAKRNSKNI